MRRGTQPVSAGWNALRRTLQVLAAPGSFSLFSLSLGIVLMMISVSLPSRAEIVDRSVAVVNGHLVTWSDLDEQMRFEALQNRRPLRELTAAERRSAFDHLVQNWILRDQMQGMFPAADEDVEARITELRGAWHLENDPARWNSLVQSYGLNADELHKQLANQLEILRFLEFRVRPLVRVTRQEVEDYYKTTLTPQLEAKGQTPEPVQTLAPKIRELLMQQKMNQELEKWLANLRSQGQVQVLWSGAQ